MFWRQLMVLNTGAVSVLAKQGLIRPCRKHLRHRHHQHRKRYTSIHMMERSVPFLFNDHWRFYLGELNGAEAVSYNDSSWDDVTLPHDYSIDQGFSTAKHRQSRRAAMCLEAPDGTAKVLHWMRACRERRSALILTVFT